MTATKKTTPRTRRKPPVRPTLRKTARKRVSPTQTRGKRTSTRAAPTRKRATTLKTAPAGKPPRKHAPAKKIAKAPTTKRISAKPVRKGSPAKTATQKRVPAKTARKRKALRGGGRLPEFKSKPKTMSDAEALAAAPNGVAVGRPRIKINWKLVERLARDHCPISEIASRVGVNTQTLRERPEFPVIYGRGWEAGKTSLRRAQFKAALAGNTVMLKWLGTFILGQVERQELTGADGGPLQIEQRNVLDLSKLSDVELDYLQALVEKASDGDVVDAEFETLSSQQQAVTARPPAL